MKTAKLWKWVTEYTHRVMLCQFIAASSIFSKILSPLKLEYVPPFQDSILLIALHQSKISILILYEYIPPWIHMLWNKHTAGIIYTQYWLKQKAHLILNLHNLPSRLASVNTCQYSNKYTNKSQLLPKSLHNLQFSHGYKKRQTWYIEKYHMVWAPINDFGHQHKCCLSHQDKMLSIY